MLFYAYSCVISIILAVLMRSLTFCAMLCAILATKHSFTLITYIASNGSTDWFLRTLCALTSFIACATLRLSMTLQFICRLLSATTVSYHIQQCLSYTHMQGGAPVTIIETTACSKKQSRSIPLANASKNVIFVEHSTMNYAF